MNPIRSTQISPQGLVMCGVAPHFLQLLKDDFQLFPVSFCEPSEQLIDMRRDLKPVFHAHNPYRFVKSSTRINFPFLIRSSFSRYSLRAIGSSSTIACINLSTCLLMLIPCSLQIAENF